jgi:hypothetical protein
MKARIVRPRATPPANTVNAGPLSKKENMSIYMPFYGLDYIL